MDACLEPLERTVARNPESQRENPKASDQLAAAVAGALAIRSSS